MSSFVSLHHTKETKLKHFLNSDQSLLSATRDAIPLAYIQYIFNGTFTFTRAVQKQFFKLQ